VAHGLPRNSYNVPPAVQRIDASFYRAKSLRNLNQRTVFSFSTNAYLAAGSTREAQ
jgi:hypothetical protein